MKSKQTGVTLMGFLFLLIVVGFLAFMVMKLFPAYTEFMGVSKAMNQLTSESGAMSPQEIRNNLLKKLDFQYVSTDTISSQDISVSRSGNATQVSVNYDKRIPFLYNIDFLVHFEKSVTMQGASG